MLDLVSESPLDALELVNECGRMVTLAVQCVEDLGPDPDKPWKDRGLTPKRTSRLVKMAFVTQEKVEKVTGERKLRRTRVGYIAALDPGLLGDVPSPRDLVYDTTVGDLQNCVSYSIERVQDWALDAPVVYVCKLVRQ